MTRRVATLGVQAVVVAIGAYLGTRSRRRAARIGEVPKSKSKETKQAPLELDSTERKILDWRIKQLLRVGFEELHATALAVSPDWRIARDAVEAGCDHRTAMRLVL